MTHPRLLTYLAPDVESLDDAVAERAEVGEAAAAVAVPRAARLAQRPLAHAAVRQDRRVVELRRLHLLQRAQPRHLHASLNLTLRVNTFESQIASAIWRLPRSTHTCGDVVELKPLQEIDVAVEPGENQVGIERQPLRPLLSQNDVHGDRRLQVARVGRLRSKIGLDVKLQKVGSEKEIRIKSYHRSVDTLGFIYIAYLGRPSLSKEALFKPVLRQHRLYICKLLTHVLVFHKGPYIKDVRTEGGGGLVQKQT